MKQFSAFLILCLILSSCSSTNTKELTFGTVADCQYCDQKSRGVRKYSSSHKKLAQCVEHFNKEDLDFVIHLGDLIDKDFKSFDAVLPIYNSLKADHYHALGNHDFDVADELKKDVPTKMGMDSKYHYFDKANWRFIILDGNDVSFHAYPKESPEYKYAAEYYKTKKITSPKWNGAVGEEQMKWLETLLQESQEGNQQVILFSHFPVYPKDPHNLWNANELVTLLDQYPCVKAYINGHNHKGNYAENKGIHYLTLKGMVDTPENTYAIIKLNQESIQVQGFGREKQRSLFIK